MPFGMKLHFGPAKVVKHQYLGKRQKCGNAARKTSFWTVFYRVSGQTTGPILMPFCIRTAYWSRTWLGVFFFKSLKKCGNAAHICIFRLLLHIYLQKYAKLLDRFWCPFAYELHIGLRRDSAYFFKKNLKIWQPCTHICIFRILCYNSKTIHPDLTRIHI